MPNIERGACRFNLRKTIEGKPAIEMEMFHNTVPHLAAVTLSLLEWSLRRNSSSRTRHPRFTRGRS